MVLTQPYTAEEVSLQSYALIRRYTEWKSERKEEIPVMVGKLKILPLQRTVEWEHKRIPVVKREFDFLYLLAITIILFFFTPPSLCFSYYNSST